MLLTELSERDATGRVKAIYEEMRHLGGVPMVALIFRHLATLPGALEWLWGAIGPAWRGGTLQEAAWRIAREAKLEPIARIERPALRAWGIDAADEQDVRNVLVAYNRANPENMLTILCALRLLGGASGSGMVATSWVPPAAPGRLPPMIDVKTMHCEVSDVLDLVAAPGEPGGPRVVQSLYRHFGHRPAFLAAAITLLRPRFDDGSIDRSVVSILAAMSQEADAIAATLSAPPCPQPQIEAMCRRFSGAVIPQMIVVGRLLDEAMPAMSVSA
jgi:hypothetical protein